MKGSLDDRIAQTQAFLDDINRDIANGRDSAKPIAESLSAQLERWRALKNNKAWDGTGGHFVGEDGNLRAWRYRTESP